MIKNKFSLSLLLLFTLFLSCKKEDVKPDISEIYGLWRYSSGLELPPSADFTETNPVAYLQFSEGGGVHGFTSRNIIGGEFTFTTDGNIQIDINLMTRVADSPWSGKFTQLIREVDHFDLQKQELTLTASSENTSLVFLKMEPGVCLPVNNDAQAFQGARTDPFELLDLNVLGTCLEARIGYSGGCKEVVLSFIGNGAYAESEPPQLGLKLVLIDDDDCEAYVQKNYYFDLTELQYPGSDRLILNVEGWKDAVIVDYGE